MSTSVNRYLDEDTSWLDDWENIENDVEQTDPFTTMSKSDQDLFFGMLDLIPDEYREEAMDYFMSHPSKMRTIIKNIKLKKSLIKNKDQAGLNKLLAKEYAAIKESTRLRALAQNDDDNTSANNNYS